MEQTTEPARPVLLRIAGEFLELAENGPAAAEQGDSVLEARINQLTRLIHGFLGQ